MTETATRPPGNLESALLTAEDTLESKRKILQLLFDSRVYVVLDQPWDGRSLPSTDMRLLFVSDGKNNEQAMLALFTSREKCAAIPKG
ncbi:MAG: SseB family protein, partial [Gammaproteobacteria bacterium]|nr:SseB family protein [Gammaproteobacteria bacterium]